MLIVSSSNWSAGQISVETESLDRNVRCLGVPRRELVFPVLDASGGAAARGCRHDRERLHVPLYDPASSALVGVYSVQQRSLQSQPAASVAGVDSAATM